MVTLRRGFRKLRILLASPEYPPFHIGGGGVVVRNVALNLSKKGHQVLVVSGYYPTRSVFEKVKVSDDQGIEVFWLPLLPTPRVSFQLKTIMPPNIFSIAFVFQLLLNTQCDIINIHGYGHFVNDLIAFCSKLLHKKYVATIHGIPKQPERQSGTLNVVFKAYSKTVGRVFFKWASTITAVSKHTAMDSVAFGADPRKIVIIPNGVNYEMFKELQSPVVTHVIKKYKLKNKKLVFGIGRLSEAKGFQFLLHAMPIVLRQIPESHLVIAGPDGGYLRKLVEIIEDLDLQDHVKLAGKINEETKKAFYLLADVVVIPSLVEPFGIVALEAMAAGKPIVASDVEGLSEILKDDRLGLIVSSGNTEAIAEGVVAVLNNSKSSGAIAKLSSEVASSYSWEHVGELYIKAYSAMK